MRPQDMEKVAASEIKRLVAGGPEGRLEELLDIKATLSALINTTIFEHPALAALCLRAPRL